MYQSAFEYVEPFESYGKNSYNLKLWSSVLLVVGGGVLCMNRVDVDIPAAGSCGWSLAGVERQPGDGRARAGT